MEQALRPSPPSEVRLNFFFEGDEFFAELRQVLEAARTSIDLEVYYLASDGLGWEFAELLAKKARAGVETRVIYDSVGCRGTSGEIFQYLTAAGVSLKAYNPLFPLPRNLRRRDHRKYAVIDGRTAFLGGYNLAAEYSRRYSGEKAWRDSGLRADSEALAAQLSALFEMAWAGKRPRLKSFLSKKWRRPPWRAGGLHILGNYGWRRKSLILQEYLSAVIHSQETFYITNSYFVPGHGFLRALKKAARRKVDVRLLTAGESDVPVVKRAGQATYTSLLKAGVRIYEYQGRVLHAKSAVADGEWFTLGTSNIDHISFFHNLEVNLFGRSPQAGATLNEQFFRDLEISREILPAPWEKRSRFAKLLERFLYFFRAWL